jgi:hypothetical protein
MLCFVTPPSCLLSPPPGDLWLPPALLIQPKRPIGGNLPPSPS